MHHTGLPVGFVMPEQSVEACKAIGMQGAGIAREVVDGMRALTVCAELIPRARWRKPAPWSFVARIAPESCGPGLPCLQFGLQLDGRVICKKRRTCPDQLADVLGQRLRQGCAAAPPIDQRRAVWIDLPAGKDSGLPVQRQVIAVLTDQHIGQKTRPGAATLNGTRWQWGLREHFTTGAGHARADDPAHDKATGNIFQLLGDILADILADLAQATATVTAIPIGRQNLILPVQVIGQRGAVVLTFRAGRLGRGLFIIIILSLSPGFCSACRASAAASIS